MELCQRIFLQDSCSDGSSASAREALPPRKSVAKRTFSEMFEQSSAAAAAPPQPSEFTRNGYKYIWFRAGYIVWSAERQQINAHCVCDSHMVTGKACHANRRAVLADGSPRLVHGLHALWLKNGASEVARDVHNSAHYKNFLATDAFWHERQAARAELQPDPRFAEDLAFEAGMLDLPVAEPKTVRLR